MKRALKWASRRGRLPMMAVAGALLVGVVAAVAVAGSSGPDPGPGADRAAGPRAGASSSQLPVIVPGRPGETARVLPPDQVKAPDGTVYGPLDAAFVRMMIPHHIQAVEMAALAPDRTANPQLLAIAGRIRAAQVPEVAQLRAWLQARGLKEDAPTGHDHATMRGMQTPDAMRALAAARGDAFDRMFVTMMSAHHQGAVDMAHEILTVVRDLQVEEMATAIAAEQAIEIVRMQELIGG